MLNKVMKRQTVPTEIWEACPVETWQTGAATAPHRSRASAKAVAPHQALPVAAATASHRATASARLWIPTQAPPKDVLIESTAHQVAASAVLWLLVPAVYATHSLGGSLLLSGGATLFMPGTFVRKVVARVGKMGRIKRCVHRSSLLTSATRPRMSFRSLMRSPAQGTWQRCLTG